MMLNLGWDRCEIDSEQFVGNLKLNLVDFQEFDSPLYTIGLFSISGTAAYFVSKLAWIAAVKLCLARFDSGMQIYVDMSSLQEDLENQF